ncbi:importin subunit beta-1 [Platysternon megacephalum]|uniref:Importin subunit beta-1 n=1 Tax=Platysternon megacephalum TaxID=55544 RepID=A0A4D9EQB6_9SAUR|nr:importin subunit beta-1 [Platysternon megacephalum]
MASAASLDLGRLVQEAEALASAVRGALGPRGGQVLMTRPTGETLLTRDGRRVLEALNLGPPTARMMVACVSSHHSMTGDGAKTFIILLSKLLRGLQAILDKREGSPFCEAIQRRERDQKHCHSLKQISQSLMTFQTHLLDHIMAQDLRKHFLSAFSSCEGEISRDTMESILEAYFCGRIGNSHQKLLSQLSCDFYYRCIPFKNGKNEMLDLVNEYFVELHSAVTGLSVSNSRILEGLVLHRDFAVYCPADGDIRMLIVTESIDSALSASGLEFVVNAEVQYQASQVWITKRTEAIMKHLQNNNIKLLLSSVKQQEITIYYAKISGISIVECLSSEEISLLCKTTGVSPFIPSQDNIRSEIAETMIAKFCRPLVLGSKRYIHLGLTRTCAFEPHCVIFCGPVHGVTEQHASAFHGAFKMLQQLFKAVDLSDGCEAQPENPNNTSKAVHCSWQQSATQQKFIMENISCNREKVNDQQLKTSMAETEKQFIDSSSWVHENPSCNQTDLQKSSDLAMPIVELESDFMFSALIDRGSSVRELQKLPLKCKHPSEMWVKNKNEPVVNNHRICNDAMTAIENTSTSVVSKQLNAAKKYWKPGNHIVPFKYEKSYKHTVQSYTNLVIQAGSVLPVGGNFEFLLHYYLHSYAKQCQQPKITLISTVIADALLSIPKILCRTTKENSFTQVYFKATSALQTNQQLPMHQQGLESVYCKYQLVTSVLHCLTKLLTIDLIIGIKRPPQKTEVNDSEEDL